jgi:DNA-binding Lrp family transcriptional regulator
MAESSKLPYVTEVNKVDGPYDIILKLYGDDVNAIKESIEKLMTEIHGIESTVTLTAQE